MTKAVYRLRRKNGESPLVYLDLNNSIWNRRKDLSQEVVDMMNKNLCIMQRVENPFISAQYLKTTTI